MRCLLSSLALGVLILPFTGCRSQSSTMTNPFLAPDRVPPPATRTLLPGTAQPYYGGDPIPTTPVIGTPPTGFTPGAPIQTAPATFAPQPAGTIPPGGWNSTPQAIPGSPTSSNFVPSNIQQASANLPLAQPSAIQIQPDQQSLRFAGSTPGISPLAVAAPTSQTLPPDPSILPTPQLASPQIVTQQASFQTPVQPQLIMQQQLPVEDPREVRIRAISSDNLQPGGQLRSSDGFRPQGTSQVRKPMLSSHFQAQNITAPQPPSDRYGFDPQFDWLRGQLEYTPSTGQWSLRYTASEGSPDPFGGQLAIANPQVLGALRAGDYVQLRGRVDEARLAGIGAAPAYNVSVVQRQRI